MHLALDQPTLDHSQKHDKQQKQHGDGRANPDEILLNAFLEDREHHHVCGFVRPTALRPEGLDGVKDLKGADARNGDNKKFDHDVSNNLNFRRKSPGKNNHNASKLVEKYSNLAREALSNGDKILSENYYQYADHFLRISIEQKEKQKEKTQTTY